MNKYNKITGYFIILIILSSVFSCIKEDNDDCYNSGDIKSRYFTLKGEGDTLMIPMDIDSWIITGLYSYNGKTEIKNGEESLSLNGLGMIEYDWYTLIKDNESELIVQGIENISDSIRGFMLIAQNGTHKEKIFINQEITAGYDFKEIEYMIKDSDNETTYICTDGCVTASYDNNSATETVKYIFRPYINTKVVSHVESDDPYAFYWINNENLIEMMIPSNYDKNNLTFDGITKIYTSEETSIPSKFVALESVEDIPPMHKAIVSGQITVRKRIYTYVITLVHKKTHAEKKVYGKWTYKVPITVDSKMTLIPIE